MSPRTLLAVLAAALILVGFGIAGFLMLGQSDTPAVVAAATTSTATTGTTDTAPSTTSTAPSSTTPTAGYTPPTAGYTPLFEEAPCAFDLVTNRQYRCGYLVVPEDRSEPGGTQVRIHVAIFDSTDSNAPDDPIIYLDGGPGGESLATLQFSLEPTWAPFIDTRDMIFFDQRGIGSSTPSLECPETRELTFELLDDDISGEEYAIAELAATETCRDRLVADGVDLTQYNSATNAQDIADLRIALRLDEWNLLGISYGTRLAQTVMRDHPQGVRSVILDSTYSPQEDLVSATPANLVRAFEQLWAGCAADTECAATYPDLENRFWALRDRLDAEPLFTEIADVFTGEDHRAVVNGDVLIGAFFQGLYSVDTIPVLPKVIADLEQGDTDSVATLLTNNLANGAFFSWGMHLSVECFEEVPFADEAEVDEAAAEADPRLGDWFEGATNVGPAVFALCDLWQAGAGPMVENEAIASDLPTLVMAGGYDPITPPAWGERVAGQLAAATYVEFPAVGHAASVAGPCPQEVALDFLDDPTAEPDTSCVDAMAPIDFVVPGQAAAPVDLIPFEEQILALAITGVRPQGWDTLGNGAWSRGATALDPTVLVQQAAPAVLDPEQALGLLSASLEFEDDPAPVGTVQGTDRTWTVYEATAQGELTLVAIGPGTTDTGVVILSMDRAEREALYDTVLVPVLEAFTTG
ncbi:MAG: alpha/beta fold hydrolase [Acidimicrobiia bacterium]|nr:alpha/beta fold hydrolase [Acidimicrobiia bacterium]